MTILRGRYRSMPGWFRFGFPILVISVIASATVAFVWKRSNTQNFQQSQQFQETISRSMATGDEEELRPALEGLLAINPSHSRAGEIKAALDSGVSPESDRDLSLMLMHIYLRKHDIPKAGREARKRLKFDPTNWTALSASAAAFLAEGKFDEAKAELERLPDPLAEAPSTAALVFAYELRKRCGLDVSGLRNFVNSNVVPLLESPQLEIQSAAAQIQMIECYLVGFDPQGESQQGGKLARGIAPVLKLSEMAFKQGVAKSDVDTLIRLGEQLNRLHGAFDLLLKDRLLTEAKYAEICTDHDKRSLAVWEFVQKVEPNNPRGYHGRAFVFLRQKRLDRAKDEIESGLKLCPPSDMLSAAYAVILQQSGEPHKALQALLNAAKADPKNTNLWVMIGETSLALHRPDWTLKACEEASKLVPQHPGVLLNEIRAHLMRDDPHAAIQRLEQLPKSLREGNVAILAVYVRCRVQAGLTASVETLLKGIEEESLKSGTPDLIASAMAAIFECDYDKPLWDVQKLRLDRLTERWPIEDSILQLKAVYLFRKAEAGSPPWDDSTVREADQSIDRIRAVVAHENLYAGQQAWLRLKGKNDPEKAMRACAGLLAKNDRGEALSIYDATACAAVLAASGKLDRADNLARSVIATGSKTARPWLVLAAISAQRSQWDRVREFLERAKAGARDAQDDRDYASLQLLVQRELP